MRDCVALFSTLVVEQGSALNWLEVERILLPHL